MEFYQQLKVTENYLSTFLPQKINDKYNFSLKNKGK